MYTASNGSLIARDQQMKILTSLRSEALLRRGKIACLTGETGYGKTYLIESFIELSAEGSSGVEVVHIECSSPVGAINLGAIQPLQPFVRLMEILLERNALSSKKKLAVNIGLTMLGMIPIVGGVFDATKEIMRDLREYNRDQKGNVKQKNEAEANKVLDEFVTAITEYCQQRPLVVCFDDVQWMDAQSVQLLARLAERVTTLPLLIILSYQEGSMKAKNSPLYAWIDEHSSESYLVFVELQPFSAEDIGKLCSSSFDSYTSQPAFETWLEQRTAGIPATVGEYINYFRRKPPFKSDGSLDTEILTSNVVPASLQTMLNKNIEQLGEEDRTLLSICSAEGREFTVFVIAKLLNTDTLTAIKKLKSLQHRTGIIKTMGAHQRYGVKTTVYEFTQALHFTYFHTQLEYEEKNELHARIAGILRKEFDETENEALRNQLAPYIAAHSIESGDEEQAKNMLVASATAANEFGNRTIIEETYQVFSSLESRSNKAVEDKRLDVLQALLGMNTRETNDTDALDISSGGTSSESIQMGLQSSQSESVDTAIVQDDITELFTKGEYTHAVERAEEFLAEYAESIGHSDHALLLAMTARALTEEGRMAKAEEYCVKANEILDNHTDEGVRCYVLNATAILHLRQGQIASAWELLQESARIAVDLTDDLKLLTVSNIALLLQSHQPRVAKSFMRTAKKLAHALRFSPSFMQDVFPS
jgi:predicted ATPase